MEKKILSIDFDIIMAPSIELYNELADETEDPEELWKDLEVEYNFDLYNKVKCDEDILYGLVDLLKHFQDKPLHFIINHEEIVDDLKKSPTYETDTYNIYNIDFHHDFWYDEEAFEEILKTDEYYCGNWLGYLYLKRKLSSVTWFKALNSVNLGIKPYGRNPCSITTESVRNLSKLKTIDFNEIYIALSPQWVPPRFVMYYNLIKRLLEKEK